MTVEVIAIVAVAVGLAAIVAVAFAVWFVLRHLDHTQRIQRRQAGLPEVPADKRPPPRREEIPADVMELIQPWDSLQTRLQLQADCHHLRGQGAPWTEIKRMLMVEDAG